jgi:sulfatase modifying factor 1
MTIGRVLVFGSILAVSLAMARVIVKRHRPPVAPSMASSRRGPVSMPSRPRLLAPQPSASSVATPPQVDTYVLEDPLSASACPEGMLLAEGTTCAETHRHCVERRSDGEGCRSYQPSTCRRGLPLRFCVDRFEYPNQEGMLPATVVTFEQARSACTEEGKRLCTEMEWTFACEGPKAFAFSYGDEELPEACNVGRPAPRLAHDAFWEAKDVAAVVEQHDARVASGAMKSCVGPFGARDLIGNVEEWVRSDVPGFERALRGGRYTGSPTCQSVRQIKQPSFRELQTGFRCCRDPLRAPREALP